MPELPEVQTTVNGLNRTVKGHVIKDVWTSYDSAYHANKDNIKNKEFFAVFRKKVKGKKILKAERRAKNILIHLSGGHTILVHMKMTGHLLYGTYKKEIQNKGSILEKEVWRPVDRGPLADPFNAFVRLVFILDNSKHLALSDMRKFAKVTLIDTENIDRSLHLEHLGPEPLNKNFTYDKFKAQLMRRPNGKVKQVLMDQSLISGIGNIYSDEMLWRSSVDPRSYISKIPEKNMKEMYKAMKEVLLKGIDFGGDSMSDYRNIKGEKGEFQEHHQAYRRTGKPCTKKGCKGVIHRTVVATRSAHYCPVHQKLYV